MPPKKKLNQPANVIEQSVHLPTVEKRRIAIRLLGETPLIVHRFEEKAITEMLAKQRGLPFERQKKNPHKDYEASKYKNVKDEDCIPVMTVKKAMVEAAGFDDNITKKQTRGAFMIIGEYAPLDYGEVRMRQDMVRLSGIGRTPDIRFRAEYIDWSVDLVIEFNPRLITVDQIIYLLNTAGNAVGICEWRVQKDGNYGAFSVESLPDKEIEDIVKACKTPRKPYDLPAWVMREINNDEDLKKAIDEAKKASGTGTSTGRGRKAAAEPAEGDGDIEVEETPAPRKRGPRANGAGSNGHSRAHADEAH